MTIEQNKQFKKLREDVKQYGVPMGSIVLTAEEDKAAREIFGIPDEEDSFDIKVSTSASDIRFTSTDDWDSQAEKDRMERNAREDEDEEVAA